MTDKQFEEEMSDDGQVEEKMIEEQIKKPTDPQPCGQPPYDVPVGSLSQPWVP